MESGARRAKVDGPGLSFLKGSAGPGQLPGKDTPQRLAPAFARRANAASGGVLDSAFGNRMNFAAKILRLFPSFELASDS
jgi:hypothetical protein